MSRFVRLGNHVVNLAHVETAHVEDKKLILTMASRQFKLLMFGGGGGGNLNPVVHVYETDSHAEALTLLADIHGEDD